MSNYASAAIITALQSSQEQFLACDAQYPELRHAILDGSIHDSTWSRELLKQIVADGSPFQQDEGRVTNPCAFYFGRGMAGIQVFDDIARRVIDTIIDSAGSLGLPLIPPRLRHDAYLKNYREGFPAQLMPDLSDYGPGAELLWLFWWLGDRYSNPVIQADRGKPTIEIAKIFNREHAAINLPGNRGRTSERIPFRPDDPAMASPYSEAASDATYPDHFGYLWHAIHFGEIKEVAIGRKGVFLCAHVGIGVLIDHIGHSTSSTRPANQEPVSIVGPSNVATQNTSKWLTYRQVKLLLGIPDYELTRLVKAGELVVDHPGKGQRFEPIALSRHQINSLTATSATPTPPVASSSKPVFYFCDDCAHTVSTRSGPKPPKCPKCSSSNLKPLPIR